MNIYEILDAKICRVGCDGGGYAERFGLNEAIAVAELDTEGRSNTLVIEVEINGLNVPIAFVRDGKTYRTANDDCPLCEGDGLIITGWDIDAYENKEERCPLCKGKKKANGAMIHDFAARQSQKQD